MTKSIIKLSPDYAIRANITDTFVEISLPSVPAGMNRDIPRNIMDADDDTTYLVKMDRDQWTPTIMVDTLHEGSPLRAKLAEVLGRPDLDKLLFKVLRIGTAPNLLDGAHCPHCEQKRHHSLFILEEFFPKLNGIVCDVCIAQSGWNKHHLSFQVEWKGREDSSELWKAYLDGMRHALNQIPMTMAVNDLAESIASLSQHIDNMSTVNVFDKGAQT